MAEKKPEAGVWRIHNPEVIVGPDSIRLPSRFFWSKRTEIPFEELRRVGMTVDRQRLVLSTRNRSYVLDARSIGGPERLDTVRTALLSRLNRHPEASRIRSTLAHLDRLEQTFRARIPHATLWLVALCALVFVVELVWGATPWPGFFGDNSLQARFARQIALGANAPALVAEGEYFRLATANFLHANLLHVFMNTLALVALGYLLERICGSWRFIFLFLLACLVGSAASAWMAAAPISVGASTGVFGLVTAYFLIWLRFRDRLPPAFSVSVDRWIGLLVINAVLWVFIRQIDHAAHLGGAVGGALSVFALYPPSPKSPDFVAPAGVGVRRAAMAIGLLFVAAGVWAAATANGRSLAEGARLALGKDVSASRAWQLVKARTPDHDELLETIASANTALQRSTGGPERARALRTIANAHYRLGKYEAAVEASFAALVEDYQAIYAQDLARHLQAHLRMSTPLRLGNGVPSELRLTLANGQVELTGVAGRPNLTVIGLVFHRYRLTGALLIEYGEVTSSTLRFNSDRPELEALRHPDVRVQLGLIATDRVTHAGSRPALKFITLDSEIGSLP